MKNPNTPNSQISKHQKQKTSGQMITSFQQQVVVTSLFDPTLVKKYSEMVPDAPERMLKIFEKNNEISREVQKHDYIQSLRRDWMGYSLALIVLLAFIFFVYIGKNGFAIGSFLGFIGMVIASFVQHKKK